MYQAAASHPGVAVPEMEREKTVRLLLKCMAQSTLHGAALIMGRRSTLPLKITRKM